MQKYHYYIKGKKFTSTDQVAEALGVKESSVRSTIARKTYTTEKFIEVKIAKQVVIIIILKNNPTLN